MMAQSKQSSPMSPKQLGFLIALASWGMLFITFFLSYLLYRTKSQVWPPIGTEAIPPLLPTVATGLLIASSFFIHGAYRQLQNREAAGFRKFWGIGTFLGFLFLVLQVGTWNHLLKMGMGLRSNFFASIYYTLTGLHALHVLAGLAALLWVWFNAERIAREPEGNAREMPVFLVPQLSGWFWHFMDAIWLVMFVLLVLL